MSDPYFNDVSLLLHMDGSDGSTTFIDSSSNALTVSVNGNAQIDTAQSKFGGASALFDGAADYLYQGLAGDYDYLHDGSAFTLEFWVRFTGTPTNEVIVSNCSGATIVVGFAIYVNGSGVLDCLICKGAAPYAARPVGTTVLSSATWYNVAVVCDGTDVTIYLDGVEEASETLSSPSAATSANVLVIGARANDGGLALAGHIDDLRITNGVARYTSNFTPPISAHPDSGATPVEGSVGQVVETNSALSITPLLSLGVAEETDAALSITPQIIIGIPIAVAEEINTALPLTRREVVGSAVETDSAFGITPLYPVRFTDPVSVTDDAGTVVSFSITDIDDPVGDATYQWYDQNGAIDSATDTTYQRELAPEDDGESVYVIATNGAGTRQSANATMTVNTTDDGVGDIAPITYRLRFGTYREPFYKNGTVILSRPLAEGESLSIERKTPITKDISFTFLEEPDWNAFEYQIDKYTMICQEIEGHLCECLECVVPVASLSVDIPGYEDQPECFPYLCDRFELTVPQTSLFFETDDIVYDDIFPIQVGPDEQLVGNSNAQLLGTPTEGSLIINTGNAWDACNDRIYVLRFNNPPSLSGSSSVFTRETGSGGDPVYSDTFNVDMVIARALTNGSGSIDQNNEIAADRVQVKWEYLNSLSQWANDGELWEYTVNIQFDPDNNRFRVFGQFEGFGGSTSPWSAPWWDFDYTPDRFLLLSLRIQAADLSESTSETLRSRGIVAVEATWINDDGGEEFETYSTVVTATKNINPPTEQEFRNWTHVDPTSPLGNRFFAGANLRLAAISFEELDTALVRYSWLANQESYERPAYCTTVDEGGLTVSPAVPGQNIGVAPGGTVTLTADATAGTPPFSYQWYKDDVEIEGATDSIYEFVYTSEDDDGDYKVVVSNDCGETSGLNVTTGESFVTIQGA